MIFLGKRVFFPENRSIIFTNYARAALEQIVHIENLSKTTIILPAFICRSGFEEVFKRYSIDPLFVDITLPSYHIDIEKAREKIEEAEALLLVHAFGLPAEMDNWVKLCSKTDTLLIEDCARAVGASWGRKSVGSFGDYAIYSLYKVSPATRGGCLVGNVLEGDLRLYPPIYDAVAFGSLIPIRIRKTMSGFIKKVKSKLDLENLSKEGKYFKSRYLDKFNEFVFKLYLRDLSRKLKIWRKKALFLKKSLKEFGFKFQRDREERVYYTVPATVPCNRDRLVRYLAERGIFPRVIWREPWGEVCCDKGFEGMYPKTYQLSQSLIHFPIQGLDMEELEFMVNKTKEFVGGGNN